MEEGLCRCNQIKMRSEWIWVGPNPMTDILTRRGKFGHRDIQRGTTPCNDRGKNWNL
jgi:hypothetical protein